ncbi:EAL domain-containing protein [Pantanalinema rosaneae CENA516]|uniref:two-component system response regulator n=1 Tax=Pantanalinema rosaneae TaxID=1620701 RepID=UPI003D6F2253
MNDHPASAPKADILIVDDTPENLRLLSIVLVQAGYGVRKALSGHMALMAVQTMVPDLILLDIMMPELDGYDVCKQLKAQPETAQIPVIFLSALSEAFDKVKAFNIGGSDYIVKPFQCEEVIIRVENQLALKAAERQIHHLNSQLEQRVKDRTRELELANARLREMALHDALTGLPNRALFIDCLQQAVEAVKHHPDRVFAVLFLDCDRFKVVNDSLGHLVGDELLIAIAHRLKKIIHPDDVLARLEGDEFAILLHDISDVLTPSQLAQEILENFALPFQLTRHEVFINASIGIALGNNQYAKSEDVLRDADTAMNHAKASGKAQYQVFDSAMHDAALQLLQLEIDLRKAINQQEFIVHYQPIVAIRTGKISGFEALVRWLHPQQGLISPGLFIPVAEETGLICQLGYYVLREACRQLCVWQTQKLVDYPLIMSVNLSTRQFAQPNLIEQIDEILQETQINPRYLKLEITESALMDNTRTTATALQELRDRGIQVSIDDFGTGYSSLNYLHRLPVDTLKIDGSFINLIDSDGKKLELVRAIVGLAWNLGMDVVAEGVETSKQLSQLKALKCEFAQGYFFSKPLEADKVVSLLASSPQW